MWLRVKNLPVNAGAAGGVGLIPGLGRSPGGGHGNPLQYSCLEKPLDRGAWRATVHGVTESDTTEQLSTHTCSRQDIHLVTPTTDLATLLKINSTARSMKSSLWQEGQIDLIFTLGLNSPSTKCLMDPNIQSINIYISMGPHLLKCLKLFLLALKLMGKQGI